MVAKQEYAIQCFEQRRYEHIFVDEHNKIHILIPLAAGKEVSLDNTCHSTDEFSIFFGHGLNSAGASIARYLFDLECDLSLLAAKQSQSTNTPPTFSNSAVHALNPTSSEFISTEIENKKSRLAQLKKQQALLFEIRDQNKNYTPNFRQYPPAIRRALQHTQQPGANCVGISLTPSSPDLIRRIDPLLFSLSVPPSNAKNGNYFSSLLLKKITEIEINLSRVKESTITKEDITQRAATLYRAQDKNKDAIDTKEQLSELKNCIRQALEDAGCDAHFDLDYSAYDVDNKGKEGLREINIAYIRTIQDLEKNAPLSAAAAAETILGFVDRLTPIEYNPFTRSLIAYQSAQNQVDENIRKVQLKDALHTLAVKVQFFLATINIYCYEQGWTIKNFGKAIEQSSNKDIAAAFIERVIAALTNGADLAETLLDYIVQANQRMVLPHEHLFFQGALTPQDRQNIINRFSTLCTTIDQGDTQLSTHAQRHWDEFWVLTRAKGNFYSLGSKIGLHLAGYCQHVLNGKLFKKYFQGAEALAATVHLDTESNCLPQNCITEIHATIDLNHIQQLDSRYIARLLISPAVGKSCKVFADPDFPVSSRQLIQQLPAWQHIYNSLVIQLSQSELQSFNEIWEINQPIFHVTQAMVQLVNIEPNLKFPSCVGYPFNTTHGFDISLFGAQEEKKIATAITFIKNKLEPFSRRIQLTPVTLRCLELELYCKLGSNPIPDNLSRYERIQHICNQLNIHLTHIHANPWDDNGDTDYFDVVHAEQLEHIYSIQNRWEAHIHASNLHSYQKFGMLVGWPLILGVIAVTLLCVLFAMEVIEPFINDVGSFSGEVISAAIILGAVSVAIAGITFIIRRFYLAFLAEDDLSPIGVIQNVLASLGTLLGITLMTGLGVGAILLISPIKLSFMSDLLFFSGEIVSAGVVAGAAAGLAFCITAIAILTHYVHNHMNKKDQDSQPLPNAALDTADATYGIGPELVTGALVIVSDNPSENKIGDSAPVAYLVESGDMLNLGDPEERAVLDEPDTLLSLPEKQSEENDEILTFDYRHSPAGFTSSPQGENFGEKGIPDGSEYIPGQSLSY